MRNIFKRNFYIKITMAMELLNQIKCMVLLLPMIGAVILCIPTRYLQSQQFMDSSSHHSFGTNSMENFHEMGKIKTKDLIVFLTNSYWILSILKVN